MEQISTEQTLRFFLRERESYYQQILGIEHGFSSPKPLQLYGNADPPSAVMTLAEYPVGNGRDHSSADIRIYGKDTRFYADCLHWISRYLQNTDHLDYHLKTPYPDSDRILLPLPGLACYKKDRTRCYFCNSLERVPETTAKWSKLNPHDASKVERYPMEAEFPAGRRWHICWHFERSVLQAHGVMYALWEDNEIVAFLDSVPAYEEIWEIDFIHVREDCRQRGLGTQIAAVYAQDKLQAGQLASYSAVLNEASARTALRAGYYCSLDLYYTHIFRQ